MDFSAVFQLRTKKFWWMDVIFYFVISLLIATLLTYVVFLAKNSLLRTDIKKETAALQTVGTEQQKEYEANVLNYQKKINDFSGLLKNHEFATNVFAFMQGQTMPNIWFKQFSLDGKTNNVQLTGESDDMDSFSRQVSVFEKNKYIKSVATLNSALGESARIDFNINLVLDQNIFGYIASTPIIETTSPSNQEVIQTPPTTPAEVTANVSPLPKTQSKSSKISINNIVVAIIVILIFAIIATIIFLIWNKIKGSKPKI